MSRVSYENYAINVKESLDDTVAAGRYLNLCSVRSILYS